MNSDMSQRAAGTQKKVHIRCKVRITQLKVKCLHNNKYSIPITFVALVFHFDWPVFYNTFQRRKKLVVGFLLLLVL